MRIHGNRHHGFAPAAEERTARTGVTGIFQPRLVAHIEEHAKDQIEAVLRTGDDVHLRRIATSAACLHLLGDRFARAGAGQSVPSSRVDAAWQCADAFA